MSKGVNQVTIIGNLGRDPEVRYTQSGSAICNLSVAVGERKKNGEEWVDHTEWVRVVCFGRTAENAGQYLAKGRQVYVSGRMQTTKYKDRDGIEKYSTEVVAREVLFLGGLSSEPPRGLPAQKRNSYGAEPEEQKPVDGFYDDDLPF